MSLDADATLIPGWRCYDWRNAGALLRHAFPNEWNDFIAVLTPFRLRHSHLAAKGGNKTETAGALDREFYARGWVEKRFITAISVDGETKESPTHDIDCFRNRVALELEWNNKDPFYDRDLNNFRLLYDLRVVDVGVLVTRSTGLMQWLRKNHKTLDKMHGTYGASTTHFDKLGPRILGGGAGGCPVFVFAMTEELYLDDR
jgi:hypothetical protein